MSDSEAIAALQADMKNTVTGIEDIKRYLAKGADRHLEVVQRLTAIETTQGETMRYQVKCDLDRTDLEKRTSSLENFRKSLLVIVTSVSGVMAFVVTTAVEWFKR